MTLHYGLSSRVPRTKEGQLIASQSDLALFKQNRRFWFLSTYLGLTPKESPVYGPLQLGSRLHDALERSYGYGHDLVESYNEIAQEELRSLEESKVVFDVRAWQNEAELGRIMLAGFDEWRQETGFDETIEIISAEEKISVPIKLPSGAEVVLRGKLDVRAKDTHSGMNLVLDWKSTANMSGLIAEAPNSDQLLTYMVLEKLNGLDDPSFALQGAKFVMLRKVRRSARAKPPFYDTVEVHHSTARLRNYYTQLLGTLEDYHRTVQMLDSGLDHRLSAYPSANTRNSWSPFNALSQVMDDDADAERMINDLFVQCSPHERYEEKHSSMLDFIE
ncbi:exonuclease [Gordonia phage GMA2]|uniref:PD-(D/E)XK endonuclease-like domain-containing protein n=1 Tax=Gordonia phage GMA2 TaxID=1647283 RepID=A0A0K0N6Y7_9CAUD|nr:exonuclease [Gordonia phage GMA2]AKJ72600.1 hypothetical protein GMA2_62 [Gordonia phage GMA2]